MFAEGKRASTSLYRLSAGPGDGRVGIATSKKIGCHARRNREKRRGREAIRALRGELKPHLNYVLVILPAAESVGEASRVEDLRVLLTKVNRRWDEGLESS